MSRARPRLDRRSACCKAGPRPSSPALSARQTAGSAHALQQTIGNHGVLRLIQASGVPGGSFRSSAVRGRGQPDHIQRMCSACAEKVHPRRLPEEEGAGLLRAKAHAAVAPRVASNTPVGSNALQGSGQPLPNMVRAYFEPRLGHDFSQVRIHTDGWAAQSARAADALAWTRGNDIVFGARQYAPGTTAGLRLLAHELTHVVQQQSRGMSPAFARAAAAATADPLEMAATAASRLLVPTTASLGPEAAGELEETPTAIKLAVAGTKLVVRAAVTVSDLAEELGALCRAATTFSRVTLESGAKVAETVGSALLTATEAKLHELGVRVHAGMLRALRHPAVRLLAKFSSIAPLLPGLQAVGWLLVTAYRIYQQADVIIRAIRTALGAMVSDALNQSRLIAKVAVKGVAYLVGGAHGRHLRGVWRHLDPKLKYMADNWWAVIKQSVWGMVWPWPQVWKDLKLLWKHEHNAARHLCSLDLGSAYDELLATWRTANYLGGQVYLWFLAASVLTGGLIGAIFGNVPGFFAGAAVGAEVAGKAGLGLLISLIAAEALSLENATNDLFEGQQTPEEDEEDYEQIANSSLTLGITAAMFVLGALAARFARAVLGRVAGRMWRRPPLRGRRGGPVSRGDVYEFRAVLAAMVRGFRRLRRVTWLERVRRNFPAIDMTTGGRIIVTPRPGRAPLYTVRNAVITSAKSTQTTGPAAVRAIEGWSRHLANFNGYRNVRVVNPAGRRLTVAVQTALTEAEAVALRTYAALRGVDLEITTALPADHPALIFVDEIPQIMQQVGRSVADEAEEPAVGE